MAAFPTTAPPSAMPMEVYYPQVRVEFEANYVQSRATATRERRRWKLSWDIVTAAEYAELETFFLANQGEAFTFTDPATSTAYSCIFSGDSINSGQPSFTGHRTDVTIDIEEV